jgi:glutamate N-acetyltransferase/amino-acid N-acetyltransferase
LEEKELAAVVINNKISNVGAHGGEEDAEAVCESVARELGLESGRAVFPSSTGIIGWKIPVDDMVEAVPAMIDELHGGSALPLALGIMTTDMFPKLRAVELPPASPGAPPVRVLGVAKGAGMIEPNLATMLVYILTDAQISRDDLRALLPASVDSTFNCLSIDADQSTSDTLLALASGRNELPGKTKEDQLLAFKSALQSVCADLAMDVVRNGEGVQHVMRVRVSGAETPAMARAVGKHIVNSPLMKTAVAGNDPNVGRIIMAVGNGVAATATNAAAAESLASNLSVSLGGCTLFANGEFLLSAATEKAVHDHMVDAWLWKSVPQITKPPVPVDAGVAPSPGDAGNTSGADADTDGSSAPPAWFVAGDAVSYQVPVDFPPHQRCVEIEVDLGLGSATETVIGNDLTHEYVAINADYRS